MNKIKKTTLLFIIIFFSITIKSDSEPPVLNESNQQYSILRNPVHACRKFVENSKNSRQPIRNHLKKLKDPKRLLEIGIFTAGTVTAMTAGTAIIHEWGHKMMLNHFFPNCSAKIEKIDPFGGLTSFDRRKINLHENNNHWKYAAGCIAGPIIGFLGSHGSFRLLAKHNTTKSPSFNFLSGLKLDLLYSSFSNILNLNPISPDRDGSKALRAIRNKSFSSLPKQWYHYSSNILLALTVVAKFYRPYWNQYLQQNF